MQKIGMPCTYTFTEQQISRMDRIAEKRGMKRAAIARVIVDLGLDCYDGFEQIGIVNIADMIMKAQKTIRESRQMRLA